MINMNKKLITIISWVLFISWMFFIFNMSSYVREDSNELSKGITKAIVSVIEKVYPDADIDISSFNNVIRKYAHFFGYMLLGILVSQVLRVSGVKGYKIYVYSIVFCVLYAISDEVHQHFVPGRGPELRDVIIDSTGSTIGITLSFLISRIYNSYIS